MSLSERDMGDCASRTVATRQSPSRVSPSRPFGRVSTIAAREAGRNAFLSGAEFNTIYDARPAKPTANKPVEIDVVARRCVYINNYRVAGGKPYVSENLPSHTLKTTLGDVLQAFSDSEIRAALREQRAEREYFAGYHEAKRAAVQPDNKHGE